MRLIRFYNVDPEWLLEQNFEWLSFLADHMGRIEIESRLEFIQDLSAALYPKSGQQHIRNLQSKLRYITEPLPTKKEVRSSIKALKRIKKRSRFS